MSDTPTSIKKICLSLNTLTFASTQILLFTLFPLLAEKLSLSLSSIVASFSFGTFLFLWGSPYWSSKSDSLGRDKVMSYGLTGLGISFAIIVALMHFPSALSAQVTLGLLVLSRFIYGALASSIVPVAQLIRSEMGHEGEHVKNMFTHSLTLSLGRMLGPILLLVSATHVETLLLAVSVWSFILLGLNVYFKSESKTHHHDIATPPKWSEVGGEVIWPLLITILFTSYTGVLHSTLGGTLQEKFSLQSLEASTLMAKVLLGGSIVMAIVQLVGKFFVKNHLRPTLFLGLFSLCLGAILLTLMTLPIQLWVAIALISLGIALIHPSNLALVHQGSSHTLGKKVGLLSSGNTIGYALGGTLASIFLGLGINFLSYSILAALVLVSVVSVQKVRVC
jgi:MFS family permease